MSDTADKYEIIIPPEEQAQLEAKTQEWYKELQESMRSGGGKATYDTLFAAMLEAYNLGKT